VKNKNIASILRDSQSRIKTMALIHEKLYQSQNLANIDLTDYLNNLCAYLFRLYVSPDSQVKYTIDAGKYTLEIDTTISIGLITNEIITNSFKYAFVDSKESIVKILLKKFDEENLELSISDNGIGLPENFDYKNSNTLGIQLVYMLTEQINGKLELTSSNLGTTYSIIFPHKK
jgi:two-component sensor histidine kinase